MLQFTGKLSNFKGCKLDTLMVNLYVKCTIWNILHIFLVPLCGVVYDAYKNIKTTN